MDLETAQGIIDAAGINVPSGDIAKGAYDERGLRYEVPDYCFGDPVNVVPEAEAAGREVPVPLHEDESEPEDEDLGKGKMPVGKEFSVRARLSDRGGPDAVIKFHETDLVRRLADMVAEKSQVWILFGVVWGNAMLTAFFRFRKARGSALCIWERCKLRGPGVACKLLTIGADSTRTRRCWRRGGRRGMLSMHWFGADEGDICRG